MAKIFASLLLGIGIDWPQQKKKKYTSPKNMHQIRLVPLGWPQ